MNKKTNNQTIEQYYSKNSQYFKPKINKASQKIADQKFRDFYEK